MKTLHLYLLRQVLATLAMTVLVFAGVLLLGNVLKEVLLLLLNQQVTPWTVVKAVGLLVPFVLAYALPMGLLTATLLVFGRFSADQELTAARSGGISLTALSAPVLLLGVVLSGLCAWINLDLAPRSRVAYKELIFSAGLQNPLMFLQEKQYLRDLPGGYTLYVDHINRADGALRDVYLHKTDDQEQSSECCWAGRGRMEHDPARQQLRLTLFDARGTYLREGNVQPFRGTVDIALDLAPLREKAKGPKLSDMTFLQLRAKIRELESLASRDRPGGGATDPSSASQGSDKPFPKDWTMPAKVQLHRMVSFSFACIGFTLVGIPLGIRAHRRETSAGMAIALLLVLLYYCFIIIGQSLDNRPDWSPHLIVWAPNFLFQAIGAALLWRANRGI